MADPGGLLSGFIGKGIEIAIKQILHHAGIVVRCKKEMNDLRDLVMSIEPMATQIHLYRLELNRKRGTSIAQSNNNPSPWVEKLHDLLRKALPIVQKCTIPSFDAFARYQMSRNISSLISEIQKHLDLAPLVILEQQTQISHMEMRRESAQASTTTFTSTYRALAPTVSFFIEEALIVGQEQAFKTLEKLVIDAELNSVFRIGVVGKGGSGKTLLLKTLFNSQKVRDLFSIDELLLWLTVSEFPSFSSLRNQLYKQIAMQIKEDHDQNMNDSEDLKKWLSQRMEAKRFALFLDDVWGDGGKLLEELGLTRLTEHSNYKIIASSRNRRALFEMGVANASIITMGDLSEQKSWELFAHHAFPYNNGNPPANINERTAQLVCGKCGGLPLAVKVIGRTMAGITDANEWELAIIRLPNANREDHQALQDRLRWSYDALGKYDINLQLCFLYLSAFIEDAIIDVQHSLIPFWLGEGLLDTNECGHSPYKMGRIYASQLVDRCLIEPVLKDVDGIVVSCRIHDVLRGLAIRIAEQEENFFCRSGTRLTALAENECSQQTRLFLSCNELSSLPKSFRAPELCSLLIAGNEITKIPRKVIGSMISLKVLDLSETSIQSLPESIGCLKQMVFLCLQRVPIKMLPKTVTNLASLQILDLYASGITELPSSIHKLRSLRYLDLSYCNDLQYLPRSISQLTSLLHLDTLGCGKMWTKHGKKKVASINDLGSLTQLKRLSLRNEGETVSERTLGSMLQMETLDLEDTMMTSLHHDMVKMSKLKRLRLECTQMVTMGSSFCQFQNLSHLHLFRCYMLEELSDLHKLMGLRKLYIYSCPKLKKFPKEFGEKGAFPSLEVFALFELDELEELPTIVVEEGAFSSLKILIIIKCEVLKMLPHNYLHLQKLQIIRVYGCSILLENMEKMKQINTRVEVVTMSTIDTQNIIEKHQQIPNTEQNWLFGEIWYNELFLILEDLYKSL